MSDLLVASLSIKCRTLKLNCHINASRIKFLTVRVRPLKEEVQKMNFLSALLVLVLAVGVYSNCGCLKCNKDFQVYSPRGSGIKVIYKNSPCDCPTGLPYSVQVPVQPPPPNAGRGYGYQIQEANLPEYPACPVPQQYDAQVQVPAYKLAPKYLLGLVAKTDRVLIAGPPEPQPGPGCSGIIVEPIQVVQRNYGRASADTCNYCCRGQSSCGCSRYYHKIPKIQDMKPDFNMQLFQMHYFTPLNSKTNPYSDVNYKKIDPGFLKFRGEDSFPELLNRWNGPEAALENSDRHDGRQNSLAKSRQSVRVVRIVPDIIRVYRRVFCLPSQNVELWSRSDSNQNHVSASHNRLPKSHQQVFLRSRPMFRVSLNLDRKGLTNTELPHRKSKKPLLYFSQNVGETMNELNTRKDIEHPNSDLQSKISIQNSDAQLKDCLQNFIRRSLDLSTNSRNAGLEVPKSDSEFRKINKNSEDNLADSLLRNVIHPAKIGNPTMKIVHESTSQNSAHNQPEKFSDSRQDQENVFNLLIDQNVQQPNSSSDLPKAVHIVKSQQMLLTAVDFGQQSVFLSTSQKFSAVSDSRLNKTSDFIRSKDENRPKRSINWKLLALKPENPPRHLRAHSFAPRGFLGQKKYEEEFQSMPKMSLKEKLQAKGNRGRTSFDYGINPSVNTGRRLAFGVNPSIDTGRRSTFRINPSSGAARCPTCGIKPSVNVGGHSAYGWPNGARVGGGLQSHALNRGYSDPRTVGKHSARGRIPLSITKRSSSFPKANKNKKKVLLKKKISNPMLKSTWKRATKVIKDWFSKETPLIPPEIQLPNYEPNVQKSKLSRRNKRRVRDEGLLPFLSFDEEKPVRKPLRSPKQAEFVHNPKPAEPFLEPLNFGNIFHQTPLLHLLNTPIRCLNHFHKLRSHVSPVVGTIPKVIHVSKRYVVDLLRNLGRNAIHLGSHFLKGFTNLKKSKILPKRRFKRNVYYDDYDNFKEGEKLSPFYFFDKPLEGYESSSHELKFGEGNVKKFSRFEGPRNTYQAAEEPYNELNQFKRRKTDTSTAGEEDGVKNWKNRPRHRARDILKRFLKQKEIRFPHKEDAILPGFLNRKEIRSPHKEDAILPGILSRKEIRSLHKQDAILRGFLNQEDIHDMFSKQNDRVLPNEDRYKDPDHFMHGRRTKRDVEETATKTEDSKEKDLGIIMENKNLKDREHPNENQSNYFSYNKGLVEHTHQYEEMHLTKGGIGDDNDGLSVKPEILLLNSDSNLKREENMGGRPDIPSWESQDSSTIAGGMEQTKLDKEIIREDGLIQVADISDKTKASPSEGVNLYLGNDEAKSDTVLVSEVETLESSGKKHEAHAGPILISSKPTDEVNPNPMKNVKLEEISDTEWEKTPSQNKLMMVIKEVKEILAQPQSKSPHSSEVDVQVQAIKDQIVQVLANIERLLNYDVSEHLHVYQAVLKLQDLKSSIVQKWKALISDKNPAKKSELSVELKEAKDLKKLIFGEVAQTIFNQDSFLRGDWIKILVRLQKFHCVVKNLQHKLDSHDFNIDLLDNLDLVCSRNQDDILANLKRDQETKLGAQIELMGNLIDILKKNNVEKVKEEAKIIWEINNVEKLQNMSILELNQKFSRGLKIRKELKILLDLQKQLEKCEQKQKELIGHS